MTKMFKKSLEKSFATGDQQHAHVYMNSREENNYEFCKPIDDEPDETDQEGVVVMVDGAKPPAVRMITMPRSPLQTTVTSDCLLGRTSSGGKLEARTSREEGRVSRGGQSDGSHPYESVNFRTAENTVGSTVTSQPERVPSNGPKEKSYWCCSRKVLLILFLLALAIILGLLTYIIYCRGWQKEKRNSSLVKLTTTTTTTPSLPMTTTKSAEYCNIQGSICDPNVPTYCSCICPPGYVQFGQICNAVTTTITITTTPSLPATATESAEYCTIQGSICDPNISTYCSCLCSLGYVKEKRNSSLIKYKRDTSLVIVGRNDGLTITNDVYQISLQQRDSVCAMKNIPCTMTFESRAIVHGQNAYVIGAGGKRPHNQTWRLDLPTTDWSRCADMITGRRRHCAVIADSQLYVLGGMVDANRTVLSSIESYSIVTNTWMRAGNLIHAVANAACVTYNNNIYVFGGSDSNDMAIAHVQVYNPVTQQCTLLDTSMPYASNLWRAVLWETSVILMHQFNCLLYNFEAKTWLKRDEFKTGVSHFGMVLYNQTIYIAGGGTSAKGKDNATIWISTAEIKSVSVLDIIDNKNANWKHHANLPQPSLVQAYFIST